jgi:hypothetical protein
MSKENENGNFAKPMLSAGFYEGLGFYETSTIEDIRELIVSKYSNRVVLNKSSQIEIMDVS